MDVGLPFQKTALAGLRCRRCRWYPVRMRNRRIRRDGLALAITTALGATLQGCEDYKLPPPTPTVSSFNLVHHVGGTHYRVLTNEGRCIQAFGSSIQVVDPQSLLVINDVPLGKFGHCGPVVDMAIVGERLWAVIEDDAVVELALPPGLAPTIRRSISSSDLGILPRTVSVVDGVVYASGAGGVVNLDSGAKVFSNDDVCGSVAKAGRALVTSVGRQVHRLDDGRYVGAASALINLPNDVAEGSSAALAFTLGNEAGSLVGLMTSEVREVGGSDATVGVPERVERLRFLNSHLFIVGSQRIDWYEVAGDAMKFAGTIDILGARDIDQLDARTFVIVGTAGRAIYQLNEGSSGGRFIAAQREASRLSMATGDGLNVLAGSREGAWMYLVNSRAELTKRTIESAPPGPRVANSVDAQATISIDGTTLSVKPVAGGPEPAAQPWEYREPKGAKMHTVMAVDGDFWIGHDRGITILRPDGGQSLLDLQLVAKAKKKDSTIPMPQPDPVKERLRFAGPVKYIFPLLAGKGASYVSEFGGFGVARFLDEEVESPPPKPK